MKLNVQSSKSKAQGFTMVEIAIAIGVIGFALVAIVGILPRGLNVQKDNREETVISQDGPYFLDAIRHGQQGLDFLTNYVERVTVQTNSATPHPYDLTTSAELPWNGTTIIGLLSKPKYFQVGPNLFTNTVTANVRALNSPATMQNGNNGLVAFKYLMTAEVIPYQYSQTNLNNLTAPTAFLQYTNYYYNTNLPPDNISNLDYTIHANRMNELKQLNSALFEIRLKFQWPLLPNGDAGPSGPHQYRCMAAGQLIQTQPGFPTYFFHPQDYPATKQP